MTTKQRLLSTIATALETIAVAAMLLRATTTFARSCARWWRTFWGMAAVSLEATRLEMEAADVSSTRSGGSSSG